MKFQYYNPIRFQFGTDAFEQISGLCRGHRVYEENKNRILAIGLAAALAFSITACGWVNEEKHTGTASESARLVLTT